MNENSTVLSVDCLSKKYRDFYALKDVSLSIDRGEIYGLVGKNGAGKSTLLKIISGLSKESQGSLSMFGLKGDALSKARHKLGALVDSPVYIPQLSAYDNLLYIFKNRGMSDRKRIDEVLEIVGLANTGKKIAKKFSLGMKQRLAIAIAILANPDLLILDEPINGLDPVGIKEVRDLIIKINRQNNTTMIVSSHILSELTQVASKIGFIDKGRLVKEIRKEEMDNVLKGYKEIKVKDTAAATVIIEEKFKGCSYKVISEDTINLFDYNGSANDIFKAFYENNVEINSINDKKESFEEYFLSVVGGNRDV